MSTYVIPGADAPAHELINFTPFVISDWRWNDTRVDPKAGSAEAFFMNVTSSPQAPVEARIGQYSKTKDGIKTVSTSNKISFYVEVTDDNGVKTLEPGSVVVAINMPHLAVPEKDQVLNMVFQTVSLLIPSIALSVAQTDQLGRLNYGILNPLDSEITRTTAV